MDGESSDDSISSNSTPIKQEAELFLKQRDFKLLEITSKSEWTSLQESCCLLCSNIYLYILVFVATFLLTLIFVRQSVVYISSEPSECSKQINSTFTTTTYAPDSDLKPELLDAQPFRPTRTASLTIIWKVPAWNLFIYLFSQLQHIDSDHDILIFIPKGDRHMKEIKELTESLNVNLIVTSSFQTSEEMFGRGTGSWHLNAWRFLVWKDWIDKNWQNYHSIFISDATDVVFLDNIFQVIPQDGNQYQFFFLEYPQPMNTGLGKKYMEWCYTQKETKMISLTTPSCAGTILGTSYSMKKYLQLQVETLSNRGGDCVRLGGDQAVHNLIMRKYLLSKYGIKQRIIPNKDRVVLSMTMIPKDGVDWEQQFNWTQTYQVIHQFKWWHKVRDYFLEKYSYEKWKNGTLTFESLQTEELLDSYNSAL